MAPFEVTLSALAPLSVEGVWQLMAQSGVPPLKLAALILIVGALAILNHVA